MTVTRELTLETPSLAITAQVQFVSGSILHHDDRHLITDGPFCSLLDPMIEEFKSCFDLLLHMAKFSLKCLDVSTSLFKALRSQQVPNHRRLFFPSCSFAVCWRAPDTSARIIDHVTDKPRARQWVCLGPRGFSHLQLCFFSSLLPFLQAVFCCVNQNENVHKR